MSFIHMHKLINNHTKLNIYSRHKVFKADLTTHVEARSHKISQKIITSICLTFHLKMCRKHENYNIKLVIPTLDMHVMHKHTCRGQRAGFFCPMKTLGSTLARGVL